jgi:hypothetical protein
MQGSNEESSWAECLQQLEAGIGIDGGLTADERLLIVKSWTGGYLLACALHQN